MKEGSSFWRSRIAGKKREGRIQLPEKKDSGWFLRL